ncbi:MAG: hypothetical protein QXR62_06195 [Candidatus Bathyarchaeia archaeon]
MFMVKLFLENDEIEERRFITQSELASFLRIADLSDVVMIVITIEEPGQPRMLRIIKEAEIDA